MAWCAKMILIKSQTDDITNSLKCKNNKKYSRQAGERIMKYLKAELMSTKNLLSKLIDVKLLQNRIATLSLYRKL